MCNDVGTQGRSCTDVMIVLYSAPLAVDFSKRHLIIEIALRIHFIFKSLVTGAAFQQLKSFDREFRVLEMQFQD